MTIAGFTFSRLLAEKKSAGRGRIDINTNISFVSAEEIDFVMGTNKQKGIKIIFEYRNTYTPDIGGLIIMGEILYLSDQKRHDDLMKSWKKEKKFSDEVMAELFDIVSVRGCVQAIQLTTTVGLPPPIPLPRFRAGGQQAQGQQQSSGPQHKARKG